MNMHDFMMCNLGGGGGGEHTHLVDQRFRDERTQAAELLGPHRKAAEAVG